MLILHVLNSLGTGSVASRFASTPEPCGSFSSINNHVVIAMVLRGC